ncbi:MAG TPA: hypothetical protein VMV10_01115 [Pirellulales bacterium]|nr:hypothetical protein [Pirellulales bacterium]
MHLTRFYVKKPISTAHIRGLRDLLGSSFSWAFSYANYCIYYESEYYSVYDMAEVDSIVVKKGQPLNMWIALNSESGEMFQLETRTNDRISISIDKSQQPEQILDALATLLSLEPLTLNSSSRLLLSAFIAHGFTDDGTAYANELARFLGLLGIRSQSGRAFSPSSVSDKVKSRLAAHDLFFAIVTPQQDFTWITQELATAAALRKQLFILLQEAVALKEGLLADHEYIPFPPSQFPRTFLPILEGLNDLFHVEGGLCLRPASLALPTATSHYL